ncbi:MAG: UbiA family prenyltransferase, partial [Croceimicrobium sp.]
MKYIKLLRVNNYIKNFYIFMPAFFSGMLLTDDVAPNSAMAFLLFSLMASAIYIINDLQDIAEDRKHPTKRNRPIASGAISAKLALSIAVVLALFSLATAWFFRVDLFYVL